MFGNNSSNQIDVYRFSFSKQPCKTYHGHIPVWQCQDSSGSNCERMTRGEHGVQTLNSEKVFGNALEQTLQSTWLLFYYLSIKKCVNFGSRFCLDNAKVKHSGWKGKLHTPSIRFRRTVSRAITPGVLLP